MASDEVVDHLLTVRTPGAQGGDVWTDRFGARAANLTLRVQSLDVAIQAPPIPRLLVTKRADREYARPGERVTYRITVTNVGPVAAPAASVTDDLSQALGKARYDRNAHASSGHLTYARPELNWHGALAPGASATITYTMTVDASTSPGKLVNTVTAPDSNCAPRSTDGRCRAEVFVLPAAQIKDGHH
jgi:uncharacterized repeat protein (TIGR01451 family)